MISMLSGTVKYSIFCLLFFVYGHNTIYANSYILYVLKTQLSANLLHEVIKNESAEWQTHLRISYSGVNVPLSSHAPFRFVNYHVSGIPQAVSGYFPCSAIHSHACGTNSESLQTFNRDCDSLPLTWDKRGK